MQNNDASAKIKSARKPILWILLLVGITAISVALYFGLYDRGSRPSRAILSVPKSSYRLDVTHKKQPPIAHSSVYYLDRATGTERLERGLGGRNSMPDNEGMLFAFPAPGMQCFWMKDMQFPLDIIWLDRLKKVVHIEQNVSPDTYPRAYCPDSPAQYVIELNAGQAGRADIQDGQNLTF